MKTNWILAIVMIILLLGCSSNNNDSGEKPSPGKEAIKKEFIKDETYKPINISEDPKKQEAMVFIQEFISSMKFPSYNGFPSTPDKRTFEFVGFIVNDNIYMTTVTFKLKTMEGPKDKMFTIYLQDLGEGKYNIKFVRMDK